jgi:hypothetical protein
MSGNFTLFTNDSGAASGPLAYVQDVFNDVSLPATNNTGLTSTSSTNPLGDYFGNNDAPRFGVKTLFIKDLVLEEDRSKWALGKPTYRIIWNENAPFVSGYISGSALLSNDYLNNITAVGLSPGDVLGVTATARRCSFLVQPSIISPTTVTVNVDGSGSATYNVGGTAGTILSPDKRGYRANVINAESSNETNDLHDFRLIATTQGALKIVGVQLYFENSGANIEFSPGSTYVNKSKSTTTSGSSLAIPSVGSILGGRSVLYKTTANTYTSSSVGVTLVQSIGTGSNAGTVINVTTGTGSQFPAGSVIAAYYGSTAYIGSVQSVSTDALTVTPAIYPSSGISGLIYKLATGGPSLVIGASLYELTASIGSSHFSHMYNGTYLDPLGSYAFQSDAVNALGVTLYYGQTNFPQSGRFLGVINSGTFMKMEANMSAAEIEFSGASLNGVGIFGGTFYVNGLPVWSTAGTSVTGIVKVPIFTDAGPGWNSFQWGIGSSTLAIAINKINIYNRKIPSGISYGMLANLDTIQQFVDQNNNIIGTTHMAWGNYKRIFASQLPIRGSVAPVVDNGSPQSSFYAMSASTDGFTLAFYGKNVALGGTFSTGTTVAIDGSGIAASSIWGRSYTALTEGFHTLSVSMAAGATTRISCVDISRTYGELNNVQNYTPTASSSALTALSYKSPGVLQPGKNIVVTPSSGAFTTSSTSAVDITNLSASFLSKGNPVTILITGDPASASSYGVDGGGVANRSATIQITRDGTIIYKGVIFQSATGLFDTPSSLSVVDYQVVVPGSYTYKAQVSVSNAAATAYINDCRMVIYEVNIN